MNAQQLTKVQIVIKPFKRCIQMAFKGLVVKHSFELWQQVYYTALAKYIVMKKCL